MTTTSISLRNITDEYAEVWRGDNIIGSVESFNWPQEVNGRMEMGKLWQARTPLNFSPVAPAFSTRREAVDLLAKEY